MKTHKIRKNSIKPNKIHWAGLKKKPRVFFQLCKAYIDILWDYVWILGLFFPNQHW